jgi:hypothetical protein
MSGADPLSDIKNIVNSVTNNNKSMVCKTCQENVTNYVSTIYQNESGKGMHQIQFCSWKCLKKEPEK